MKDFTEGLLKFLMVLLACAAIFCFERAFSSVRTDIQDSKTSLKERHISGNLSNDEWRVLMISKGLAEYNATNGNWQWKDQSK